jgi:uncharacterized membrane protein YeiH
MSAPLIARTVALPIAIDVGATFLFSISGAMVTIRRRYDLIGVFVLALACGLGGIFVGVVNAVGSGLIRDVLVREEPLLFKPGQFYLIASVLGVAGFTLLAFAFHAPLVLSAILAIAITFVFRILAILFDWKTRSVMRSPSSN